MDFYAGPVLISLNRHHPVIQDLLRVGPGRAAHVAVIVPGRAFFQVLQALFISRAVPSLFVIKDECTVRADFYGIKLQKVFLTRGPESNI